MSDSAFKRLGRRIPWEIITRIERAPDHAAVTRCLAETAGKFGFASIFAGFVPSREPPIETSEVAASVVVSTMPRPWQARYLEQGYVFRDPVVHRLRADPMPFTWAEAYSSCDIADDVTLIKGEASEFGLRDGFVVPILLLDGVRLAFSFGAATFDRAPDGLSTLAFATNIAAGRLLDLAAPRLLRAGEAGSFLTGRERDCLLWAAEGKTDWEIANILGVSVPTVRKHLASARDKLQAVNKYHAIAIGFRTGLIK